MVKYDHKWPPLTPHHDLLNKFLLRVGLSPSIVLKDANHVNDLNDSTLAFMIVHTESKDDEITQPLAEEQLDYVESGRLNHYFTKQIIDNTCSILAFIYVVLSGGARKCIGK